MIPPSSSQGAVAGWHRRILAIETLWSAALVLPWLLWSWHMKTRWSLGWESYFGWAVIPFAAYLFVLKWDSRPFEKPPIGRYERHLGWGLAVAGGVTLSLANIVLAPNPLWTAAAWVACFGCTLSTLGLLFHRGGRSWVAHFIWLPLFMFLALPWPNTAQLLVVDPFRQAISWVVAELISSFGVPALASGAMIELPSGKLVVDAACSGIRSLQTAIMLGLFLSELMRFRLRARAALLAGAGAIVVLANFLRVLVLASLAATRGVTAIGLWHDVLGNAEMLVVLILVPGLALIIHRRRISGVDRFTPSGAATGAPFSPRLALAICTMLVTGCMLEGVWYSASPGLASGHLNTWRMQPLDQDWQELPIDDVTRTLLGCRKALVLASREGMPHAWIAAYMRWDSDPAHVYTVGAHSPELCLSNSGAVFEAKLPPLILEVEGRRLEFEQMRFSARGEPFHVFVLRWSADTSRSVSGEELQALEFGALRRSLVLERKSAPVLEKITIAVSGYKSDAEARARAVDIIPRLLHAESGSR